MRFQSSIGFLLLAIYLILIGLVEIFALPIPGIIIGILALIAGILILISK